MMIPIQDLLHRIRWDPEFGRDEFIIGYYDRVEHEIILVPFREISFPWVLSRSNALRSSLYTCPIEQCKCRHFGMDAGIQSQECEMAAYAGLVHRYVPSANDFCGLNGDNQ